MDLLTFGQVILFENCHYVLLVLDEEEKKIHLAKILDVTQTELLRKLDDKNAKNPRQPDSSVYAYVILTTEEFYGRAAHLKDSDGHIERSETFSVLRTLDDEDIKKLKKYILDGKKVLPARLINLVKRLG